MQDARGSMPPVGQLRVTFFKKCLEQRQDFSLITITMAMGQTCCDACVATVTIGVDTEGGDNIGGTHNQRRHSVSLDL